MTINPVQPNLDNKNTISYREQKTAIKTNENIKPLSPKGHLVHDTLVSIPKFWIKDIAYDMKALKEGFQGKTNDHQQGRLNDVGLKIGGIGIAAYLASRTTDPKIRLMEYVGLGSFLAAMSLYPQIAINMPSRLIQGFDIGKEYIDDQGRKKSVFQDSNYIPFDMYQGEYPGEDLDIIGDRMGIPRDIKNRHDLIKEQMRKVATQNNTLWMLTAGFATPVMAALMCVGLEKLLLPAMEKARNLKVNHDITSVLKATENMNELKENALGNKVSNILKSYDGKELPKEEYEKIVTLLTEKTDSKISTGIKEDLAKILKSDTSFRADKDAIISVIKENIPSRNRTNLEKIFVPNPDEVERIISSVLSDSNELSEDNIRTLKNEFRSHFESKMPEGNKEFYKAFETDIVNKIAESIKNKPSNHINGNQISEAVNFAKIIGDFKDKEAVVDKCLAKKFEEAPQTMLANSYERFENTLFDVLEIKYKDIKTMKESPELAEEIIKNKLEALIKDEAKYEKAVTKLSKSMVEMDKALEGTHENSILDLVHATENIYNNTAKRLNKLNSKNCARTIDYLIKEDASNDIQHIVKDKEDLTKFLDGTLEAKQELKGLKYAEEHVKGVGSAKRDAIARMVERYQGVRNSFNRILHTMDVYKRGIPEGKYESELAQIGRELLLGANSSQFNQKFKMNNNPELYRDVMYTTWGDNKLTNATKNAVEGVDKNLLDRFNKYIERVRLVLGNNTIDFTKPHHVVGQENINAKYRQSSLTRRSMFDLVAQDPISMIKKAAERKNGNLAWLRRASAIAISVLGVAVGAQFLFGKIKNPHNIQKQVSDENS